MRGRVGRCSPPLAFRLIACKGSVPCASVAGAPCGEETHALGEGYNVEAKLRLQDAVAHKRVLALFTALHKAIHVQGNVPFDGANQELNSTGTVLCLCLDIGSLDCNVVTLKENVVIGDGSSRGYEVKGEGCNQVRECDCLKDIADSGC